MKTKDVSNIEALIGQMEREVNKVEHEINKLEYELEVASDYAVAYRDLVTLTERKIKELTAFISQHKEAK